MHLLMELKALVASHIEILIILVFAHKIGLLKIAKVLILRLFAALYLAYAYIVVYVVRPLFKTNKRTVVPNYLRK